MAFEKHGEIRRGYTRPENDAIDEKVASEKELEEHLSKRLAEAAVRCKGCLPKECK